LKRITYINLLNRTLEMYMKGDYLEAYNFITDNYQGIKGYVVYGNKDDDCYECTRRFTDLLGSKKITYKLKIIKGLDHDYPDNFNEILPKAIEFILKN